MKHLTVLALLSSAVLHAIPGGQLTYEESKREAQIRLKEMEECLFLDPYVQDQLDDIGGKIVLDAGCGAARFGIRAAQEGASVVLVNQKEERLLSMSEIIKEAGCAREISLMLAEATDLPYNSSSFDRIHSVNSSGHLPSRRYNSEVCIGFEEQISELARVLNEDGKLTLVLPSSYGVLFTDGRKENIEVMAEIHQTLSSLKGQLNEDAIREALSGLEYVTRATFVEKEGALKLVQDESELRCGDAIWRVDPEGIHHVYYHSEEEVLVALRNAGLKCTEVRRPCFYGKVKYKMFNNTVAEGDRGLGESYIDNHPFTIYSAVKRA